MMRKIALIFVFLSFLCITVSLVMPWFQGHYHGTGDGDYTYLIEEHFYLNEVKKYDDRDNSNNKIYDYDGEFNENYDEFMIVINYSKIIIYSAIIISLLTLIFLVFANFNKISLKIPLIFGVIAIILMFAAPIFMMVELPGALKRDISSSYDQDFEDIFAKQNYPWEGDSGWYLSIIGGIFGSIGAVFNFSGLKSSKKQLNRTQLRNGFSQQLPPPYPITEVPQCLLGDQNSSRFQKPVMKAPGDESFLETRQTGDNRPPRTF